MVSKLEIRLINYFLLIAFAAILIGIEFYFEMDSIHGQHICNVPDHNHADQHTENPLNELRNKILIMFILLSIVVAIVLAMFIKNITTPLGHMAEVASHINEGDLTHTVTIEHEDEIGQVGIAINDLASNLQEIATFTSITSGDILEKISALKQSCQDDKELASAMQNIESNLESLTSFVDSFKLLDTNIK